MVLHMAWTLNFNMPLSSFESQVKGTRSLIDLARSCERRADLRFLFAASVTVAHAWDRSNGPYPEKLVMDAKYAIGNGYGESKYVVERVHFFLSSMFTKMLIPHVRS